MSQYSQEQQDQALAQINGSIHNYPPQMQQQIRDALSRGVPPATVQNSLNHQRVQMMQRQQQMQQQAAAHNQQQVHLSAPNQMGPPSGFPDNAANQAHMANARPSMPLSSSSNPGTNPSSAPPQQIPLGAAPLPVAHNMPGGLNAAARQHQRGAFLRTLATQMTKSGNPLPPALIGEPNPAYDPTKSRFNILDIPAPGYFNLAGKNIDLQELFHLVTQGFGGSQKVSQSNGWPAIAQRFGLPETFSPPNAPPGAPPANSGGVLSSFYVAILGVFENVYTQLKQHARQPGIPETMPSGAGGVPLQPPVPGQSGVGVAPALPGSAAGPSGIAAAQPGLPGAAPVGFPNLKRKFEGDHLEGGQTPIPTEARKSILPIEDLSTLVTPPGEEPKHRLKIEYTPIARQLDSYGGRKLEDIEKQLAEVQAKRVPRSLHDEWGPIEIEGLIMSLASGLGNEVSYALTTLTMLSLIPLGRDNPNVGIPLQQCEDLLDTLVDVLEDVAFGEEEDEEEVVGVDDTNEDGEEDFSTSAVSWTRAALLRQIEEEDTVQSSAKLKARGYALKQDPASVILTIINILRNFLGYDTNRHLLCTHYRMLNTLARISDVTQEGSNGRWRPVSATIELNELLKMHSELISFLSMMDLYQTQLPRLERRTTRRIYNLLLSPLIDPRSSLEPRNIIVPNPAPPQNRENTIGVTSSLVVELVLDAFVKISLPDENRAVFAKPAIIPPTLLVAHFQSLIRMLPVTEEDFVATTSGNAVAVAANLAPALVSEALMGYVERIVQSLHSLVFLAPPKLKLHLRTQTPGLVQILVRMAQYYVSGVRRSDSVIFGDIGQGHRTPNPATGWIVVVRRIYETLSLLDSCVDAFEPVPNTPLAFAPPSRYARPSGNSLERSGSGGGSIGSGSAGLLGSRFSELLVTSLLRDNNDPIAFQELDELLRLGPSPSTAVH